MAASSGSRERVSCCALMKMRRTTPLRLHCYDFELPCYISFSLQTSITFLSTFRLPKIICHIIHYHYSQISLLEDALLYLRYPRCRDKLRARACSGPIWYPELRCTSLPPRQLTSFPNENDSFPASLPQSEPPAALLPTRNASAQRDVTPSRTRSCSARRRNAREAKSLVCPLLKFYD